jgi:hypothetical protein
MTPDWWHVYNNVKHHFSENFEKANLKNIRDILAGAFLLNIVHVPAYLRLIEYGVVKSGYTMKVSFTLNTGWQERVKELIRKNKSLGNIETALFSYDYRKEDESLASSDFPQ